MYSTHPAWEKLGIDVSHIRREGKTKCPKCSPTSKHKNARNLSVNVVTGDYNCHNTPCEFRGNALVERKPQREYVKPQPRLQKVSDRMLNYFENDRKISNNTLLLMKVTEEPAEWMPQDQRDHRCICFNYFRDENLVNIKFRSAEKHFKMAKDAELIFYNLDSVRRRNRKFVVIVEGEIDALTLVECGINEVISVPNGANQIRPGQVPKLEYLDNCWDDIAEIPVYVIAVDSDEAGKVLEKELIRRLGPDKCFTVKYPAGCKDFNEVLVKHGKTAVLDALRSENLKEVPVEGIQTMDDLEEEADYIYNNGYPKTLKLDWELDKHLTWMPGDVTVVTGIPNHGKSTWVSNVVVELAHKHGWVWAVFSPEKNRGAFLVAELAAILIGLPTYRANPDEKMSREDWKKAKDFIREHFIFIKTDGANLTLTALLSIGRSLVRRYGINGFLADPWNYIEADIPAGVTEHTWVGQQLTIAGDFAKETDVHVIFVAHPKKMEKEKGKNGAKGSKYIVPTMYDISGSSNWNNKVDNGVCIFRNYEEGTTTVYIQKVRWFFVGKAGGSVKMTFDPNCQRFRDYIPPPDLSPEQATYEEKKANQKIAERGRELFNSTPVTIAFPPVLNDGLPF